ncbi:MAG: RluA family pseudouridine synthase, partial [Coprobacillaceae bacterium]
ANQRIDKYMKKLLVQAPTNFIYKMFRKKDIKINGKAVNEKYILQQNDVLQMFLYEDKFLEFTKEKNILDLPQEFDVLYEDDQILVVNKPVGLLVHEDYQESINTLSNQVLTYLAAKGEYETNRDQTFTPGPVHRLDRNTSGIVIFGKTMVALQTLNEMIKQRYCIEKKYLTIVKGAMTSPRELEGYIKKVPAEARVTFVKKDAPGALSMRTKVFPIKNNQEYSLVEVQLVTGRMHQIRIHLASIDHPIIGDTKYGDFTLNKKMKRKYHLQHQLLHAYKIKFIRPIGKLAYLQDKEIVCPVSNQFKNLENKLL